MKTFLKSGWFKLFSLPLIVLSSFGILNTKQAKACENCYTIDNTPYVGCLNGEAMGSSSCIPFDTYCQLSGDVCTSGDPCVVMPWLPGCGGSTIV